MKSSRVLLAILLFLGGIVPPGYAADETFQVDADTLVISADTGSNVTTVYSVQNMLTIPQDVTVYYERTKETGVYSFLEPAHVDYPNGNLTLPPGGYMAIPVTFHFGALGAGEYRGKFQVGSNGTDLSVPVKASLRAPGFLPFILLLASVITSVMLYNYDLWWKSAKIKKQLLELKVRIDEDELLSDNSYAKKIRDRMITIIDSALVKISNDDLTGADDDRKVAEKLWTRWSGNRITIKEQLDLSGKIIAHAEEMKSGFPLLILAPGDEVLPVNGGQTGPQRTFCFLGEILISLDAAWDTIAATGADDTMKFDTLATLASNVDKVKSLLEKMTEMGILCGQEPDDTIRKNNSRLLSGFTEKLQIKSFGTMDIDALETDLDGLLPKVTKQIAGLNGGSRTKRSGPAIVSPSRMAVTLEPGNEIKEINKWIQTGMVIKSIIIPTIVLTITGFYLLYLQNPIFGSLIDYSLLVLWGIMSCAATDGIWEKVQALKPAKYTST